MQLSVETVVWVVLALVVVAVVGLFLLGSITTSSHQASQKFYVRLEGSQYSDPYGGYIVSLRAVNNGENGANLTNLTFDASAFSSDAEVDANLDGTTGDNSVALNLTPRASADVTIGIKSSYVSGDKVLVVTADFSDSTNATLSVDVP